MQVNVIWLVSLIIIVVFIGLALVNYLVKNKNVHKPSVRVIAGLVGTVSCFLLSSISINDNYFYFFIVAGVISFISTVLEYLKSKKI